MKHVLQVLIFAAACGATAAHAAKEAHQATTSGPKADASALTAFNFPKITYKRGVGAARAEQRADEAAERGIDSDANTLTALNFIKITFSAGA